MFYGLDVHKSFIQVCCIDERGKNRRDFKIGADHDAVTTFAEKLTDQDAVVLEATFHSWAIWSLLQGQSAGCRPRVVVANSMQVKAIAHARIKTDKVDAHILAQLLRSDFIPEVVMPDRETWELRQLVTHRRLLAKHRTATRNAIHGILHRKLLKTPVNELFGPAGRKWLEAQEYTELERFMLDNDLAHLDDINERLKAIDERLRALASMRENARLLVTIPGVGVATAMGLLSAIGDVSRFATPEQLASYFGLVPRVHQSAESCYHGPITKQGRSQARWLAVEAAQSMVVTGAPLTATYHRVRRKKAHNVAVVALARKLVVLVWHMLVHQEPYRYAQTKHTRVKLRRVTPGVRPAKAGCVPTTLEEIYEEARLPALRPPAAGEKRATANNRRTITRHRKQRSKRTVGA
jgi:transposase